MAASFSRGRDAVGDGARPCVEFQGTARSVRRGPWSVDPGPRKAGEDTAPLDVCHVTRYTRVVIRSFADKHTGHSINDQWRVCFRFEDGDAYEVEVCDDH